MVTRQFPLPARIWPVQTRIPDEHEGDILSTTDDHFRVVATARDDLDRRSKQDGLSWLVRGDAQIRYPRADGSIGSLYPDVLVAYDVWVAGHKPYEFNRVGKPPELLIEILSNETARNDVDDVRGKLRVYAEMGIREYLTFDPRLRKKLALHGYQLARVGQYVEIPPLPEGGVWLEGIGLRVVAEPADRAADRGPLLRWYRPDGTPILHLWEEADARVQAERERERAEQERQQAQLRERQAERARQRAEKAQEHEQHARVQAEQAQEREQQARMQAEQERDAAQAEIARLRALLGLGGDEPPAPHNL